MNLSECCGFQDPTIRVKGNKSREQYGVFYESDGKWYGPFYDNLHKSIWDAKLDAADCRKLTHKRVQIWKQLWQPIEE